MTYVSSGSNSFNASSGTANIGQIASGNAIAVGVLANGPPGSAIQFVTSVTDSIGTQYSRVLISVGSGIGAELWTGTPSSSSASVTVTINMNAAYETILMLGQYNDNATVSGTGAGPGSSSTPSLGNSAYEVAFLMSIGSATFTPNAGVVSRATLSDGTMIGNMMDNNGGVANIAGTLSASELWNFVGTILTIKPPVTTGKSGGPGGRVIFKTVSRGVERVGVSGATLIGMGPMVVLLSSAKTIRFDRAIVNAAAKIALATPTDKKIVKMLTIVEADRVSRAVEQQGTQNQ